MSRSHGTIAGFIGSYNYPVTVDFRLKPDRGREEVMVSGYLRVKGSAVITADDLTLRTIKQFFFNPYAYTPTVLQGLPVQWYGSITNRGSLMNEVSLRAFRGSITPHTGTQHIGTRPAIGTYQLGYFAIGA